MHSNFVSCPCPQKGMGRLIEGGSQIVNDTITIINAPDLTKQALGSIALLFEERIRNQVSDDQLVKDAKSFDSNIGSLIERYSKNFGIPTIMFFVLIAVAQCAQNTDLNVNSDIAIDVNRLIDQKLSLPPSENDGDRNKLDERGSDDNSSGRDARTGDSSNDERAAIDL